MSNVSLEEPGGPQERFLLMLHDRVVNLEKDVAALRAPLDPRIKVLGTRAESECGAVLVRLLTREAVDVDAWSESVLGRLALRDDTRFDLRACQHFGLGRDRPWVAECLVERSGCGPLSVARVAHAALDSLDSLDSLAADGVAAGDGAVAYDGVVEACAVVAPAWFAESIRVASGGTAVLHSWDPAAGCVSRGVVGTDETGSVKPEELAAWTLLHGWLASQVEPAAADLWHPRAPASSKMGMDLVRALGRGLAAS